MYNNNVYHSYNTIVSYNDCLFQRKCSTSESQDSQIHFLSKTSTARDEREIQSKFFTMSKSNYLLRLKPISYDARFFFVKNERFNSKLHMRYLSNIRHHIRLIIK